MSIYIFSSGARKMSTGQLIRNMIFLVLFLVALFFIARGIYRLLAWVAPVLIILTMLIRFKVVSNFVKTLWNLIKRSPVFGVIAVILSVLAFPLVAVFLFGQAVFTKKLDDARKEYDARTYGEETEYEEVATEINLSEFRLPENMPDVEAPKDNKYDDFFDQQPRS